MKKITFLFLILSHFVFSQEEDYSKIFSNFDSIQKNSLTLHANQLLNVFDYNYVKSRKDGTRQVIMTMKLDSIGKLNLVFIENKSSDLESFFTTILEKIPLIEISDENNAKITEEFITCKFTLHPNTDLSALSSILFEKETDTIKQIKNLDIYPSFGMLKKGTDKEKSMEDFNKNISKHIVRNFVYPKYARNNNITGKTFVFFIIEKEGSIERIIVTKSNPVLHFAGIDIISKLPKLNPGISEGKPIRVSYGLPLTFRLE
ncbi:energy transducer TonB [Flavobacterium sp. J27]|uniref:energy transducer TonB n=1 Tax=Flavobacterium sp. J27 TaxID=2060419 RepID=UPI00102F919C|nr:energy transducer TonB [Flavobacterium sp. J27]